MPLLLRLVRALWIFGTIFASYVFQWALVRVFRRFERDAEGREHEILPPWIVARRRRIDSRNAKRLLGGILKLRGVYIKLGQVLSIMGGFLPRVYGRELEQLQDQVPPTSWANVERAITTELKKHPDEIFASFDREPLAAASLGQVHRATTKDGVKVAVKILYPGIRDVIRVDMRVVRLAMRAYKLFFPFGGTERIYHSLVDLLRRETDYIHEGECMTRMRKNFEGDDTVAFPEVLSELTTDSVLTMTFMEGIKITKFEELDKLGVSRTEVATRLVQAFYKMLFLHRLFHADPHPGNFLVQPTDNPNEPKVVVLDFGAVSEAREELLDGMMDVLQGVFVEDSSLALKGIRQMGFVATEGNRELLERTVITYFQKLMKIRDRTPAALMRANPKDLEALVNPEVEREDLRELMKSFDYPEGWFYIERACVLMFWLCGQIDPELDTMQVGFPYVAPLLLKKQQEMTATL